MSYSLKDLQEMTSGEDVNAISEMGSFSKSEIDFLLENRENLFDEECECKKASPRKIKRVRTPDNVLVMKPSPLDLIINKEVIEGKQKERIEKAKKNKTIKRLWNDTFPGNKREFFKKDRIKVTDPLERFPGFVPTSKLSVFGL